jgi:hypothetical protein
VIAITTLDASSVIMTLISFSYDGHSGNLRFPFESFENASQTLVAAVIRFKMNSDSREFVVVI